MHEDHLIDFVEIECDNDTMKHWIYVENIMNCTGWNLSNCCSFSLIINICPFTFFLYLTVFSSYQDKKTKTCFSLLVLPVVENNNFYYVCAEEASMVLLKVLKSETALFRCYDRNIFKIEYFIEDVHRNTVGKIPSDNHYPLLFITKTCIMNNDISVIYRIIVKLIILKFDIHSFEAKIFFSIQERNRFVDS